MKPSYFATPAVAARLDISTRHLFRLLETEIVREPTESLVHPQTRQRVRLWTEQEAVAAHRAYLEYQLKRSDALRIAIESGRYEEAFRMTARAIMSGRDDELIDLPTLAKVLQVEESDIYKFTEARAKERFKCRLKSVGGTRNGIRFRLEDVILWLRRLHKQYVPEALEVLLEDMPEVADVQREK
jgi:hypothetical protein